MMASWLRYKCGASVAVLDLDDPMHSINEIRQVDIKTLSEGGKELLRFVPVGSVPETDWYPVIAAAVDGGEKDILLMENLIGSLRKEYDYLIIDFGGSFSEGDAIVRFLKSHILDLMVVPIYTDETVLLSALELCYLASEQGQDRVVFWNRVTRSERPDGEKNRLAPIGRLFSAEGTEVLDTLIPDLVMFRRDSRTWRFIRSTACWPQANIDQICPELEQLFSSIRLRLDSRQSN